MTLPSRPLRPEQAPTKGTASVFSRIASPEFTGKPVQGGQKSRPRLLGKRIVQDGERTYTAYSADELIEIDSLAHHGRPGQAY